MSILILQCFSAVVGPNGSGKSNVIDAMLFVFGKRAKQVLFLVVNLITEFLPSRSVAPNVFFHLFSEKN